MLKQMIITTAIVILAMGCKESRCSNGEQNKKEEGIDCGGPCAPCATCSDGVKNQDEVEVDCGGACAPCAISYPESGTYGSNVLSMNDTLYLDQADYSFRAVIPEGSTLKIKLNSVSGGSWWLSLGDNVGWSYNEFDGGVQIFEALNATCDLRLILSNMTGMFQVWYYENSESVTRVSYVYVD